MEMWKSPTGKRRSFPTFPQALLRFSFFLDFETKNQSHTATYELGHYGVEKIQVAHPASHPVLDSCDKQHSNHRSEGQDAIEDYSESGAKVQVLCLRKRQLGGIGSSIGSGYRDCGAR